MGIILVTGVIVATGVGLAIGWILRGTQSTKDLAYAEQRQVNTQQELDEIKSKYDDLTTERNRLSEETSRLATRVENKETRNEELIQERDQYKQQLTETQQELSALQTRLQTERTSFAEREKAINEKLGFLEQAREQLKQEFTNTGQKILDAKAEVFRKSSTEQLEGMLKPFREQIDLLHKDVKEASKERHSLSDHIKTIVAETNSLSTALRGDTKRQGDWGEMLLESILENSGLRRGEEYEIQPSFTTEEGGRARPDVIIYLPENRQIVIDSKVSVVAYDRYVNAEDPDEQQRQLLEHIRSMRNHIKKLADKSYNELKEVHTLDYILMWVPLESAFFAAMGQDRNLVAEAMDRRVIPVSATTLFAVLKTIERVWRYERQNRNVEEIFKRAKGIYDKVVSFTDSMDKVGINLDRAQDSFRDACKQLRDGRGNLIRQVEMLQDLGVTPSKQLNQNWQSYALEEHSEES